MLLGVAAGHKLDGMLGLNTESESSESVNADFAEIPTFTGKSMETKNMYKPYQTSCKRIS